MKQFKGTSTLLVVILAIAGLAFAGCAGPMPKSGEVFPCVADGNLDKTIAPEAELTEFSCMFKEWSGSETLHFTVGVKNVSSTPQRYKVNIFLDNGKAVGGLIPRKTKKGLVKPGETATFVYPVSGMHEKAKSIMLRISTLSQ